MKKLIKKILANSDNYYKNISKTNKKKYSQFFTPYNIGSYMSNIIEQEQKSIKILDPGAGTGILATTIIEKIIDKKLAKNIYIDLYEIDLELIGILDLNLKILKELCRQNNIYMEYNIINENFITNNKEVWKKDINGLYDIIISNPPYKKLKKSCKESAALKSIVYGQPNLYFLFLAMSIKLLKQTGELCFILPRGFFTGKYFSKFRQWMLDRTSIDYIHYFNSRDKIFNDDILQEIIIIKLIKKESGKTVIATCQDSSDLNSTKKIEISSNLLIKNDNESFILLPRNNNDIDLINFFDKWENNLLDLGLKFSTGKVVNFRNKDILKYTEEETTCPLIWPINFSEMYINWPIDSFRYHQYIDFNDKVLLENKNYLLIKRMSSKEQSKRIQPNIYLSKRYDFEKIGIENHVNYLNNFEFELSENVIYGFYILLNSSYYDRYYRIFNGNTQVNAYELNNMSYPKIDTIKSLGKLVDSENVLSENECNEIFEGFFNIKINL